MLRKLVGGNFKLRAADSSHLIPVPLLTYGFLRGPVYQISEKSDNARPSYCDSTKSEDGRSQPYCVVFAYLITHEGDLAIRR